LISQVRQIRACDIARFVAGTSLIAARKYGVHEGMRAVGLHGEWGIKLRRRYSFVGVRQRRSGASPKGFVKRFNMLQTKSKTSLWHASMLWKEHAMATRHPHDGAEPPALESYSSNLTDPEWALLADLFERVPGQRGTLLHYSRCEPVNACSYVLRTVCAWRLSPARFPPW
jgi:hypothetical protein